MNSGHQVESKRPPLKPRPNKVSKMEIKNFKTLNMGTNNVN